MRVAAVLAAALAEPVIARNFAAATEAVGDSMKAAALDPGL